MSITTDTLYQAISSLDPHHAYQNVTYNLTAQNTLQTNAWWIPIPYGSWANAEQNIWPNPSPFEQAITAAIASGAATTAYCFIDLLQLAPAQPASGTQFYEDSYVENADAPHPVEALITLLNSLPTTVTPIIRYLIGMAPITSLQPKEDGFVVALQKAIASTPITNSNAKIYYGNFSPVFEVGTDQAQRLAASAHQADTSPKSQLASSILSWLLTELETVSEDIYQQLKKLVDSGVLLDLAFTYLNGIQATTGNWNHSKTLALNGQTMVTGGANCWGRYATGNTWLFDMSLTIQGSAVADAHHYADYMWQYLNTASDTAVQTQVAALSGDQALEFSPSTAPLYADNYSPTYTGKLNALTIGKNGIEKVKFWGGLQEEIPVQLVDALRDLLLNIVGIIDLFTEVESVDKGKAIAFMANLLNDGNPQFVTYLAGMGVNPTGWASRYARSYAISNATSAVYISQQKLVMDDLMVTFPAYQQEVAKLNKELDATWDGAIWPYDLLSAMGYALVKMHLAATTGDGMQVVCSCTSTANGDYEDPLSSQEFAAVLKNFMVGMQLNGYFDSSVTTDAIGGIVDNYLHYNRITPSSSAMPEHANHSKIVMVDKEVLYIGSENTYPSYNEEFGVWVDDANSIEDFYTNYWAGLWSFSVSGAEATTSA